MESFLITKEGFEKLKAELTDLKDVQRPKVIDAIAAARELGDLKENAEYHAAREKQGMIEATIATLEDKSARAEVVDVSQLSGKVIRFGATVRVEDEDEHHVIYKIVSDYEADIEKGLISVTSPVARALLGRKEGDEIEIKTPGGVKDYEILKVEWK